MGNPKIVLNGTTLIDLTSDTVASNKMLSGVTAHSSSGDTITGTIVTNNPTVVSVSGSAVTVPSGYYENSITKIISAGSATTPATTITVNPTISVDGAGLITASYSSTEDITPTIVSGYISSGTAGTVIASGFSSLQLSIQSAATITPTESSQTAVASGKYTTGAVTVAAVPSDYIGSAIASVEVDEGITTVSGSTATRGDAIWSAGIIAAGNMGAATFANSSSGQTQYVDISNTTEAPVLVSGGYLYINKGYTDDLKISLAKLVPDGASADLASGVILSGYAAYDNDGNLVAGNIPTKSSSNVTASGSVVTVPSGYYATEVSKAIASAKFYEGMDMTNLDPSITVSNTGLITAEFSDTYTGDFVRTPGYASQAIMTFSAAGSSSYQLSTVSAATITPTESSQVAAASGKYTLGDITVAAVSSNYVGSNIPARSSSNLSASGSVVTAAAGYYANAASKAVAAGTATTPATTITANPGISVNSSTGVITATTASSKSITPTISAGYINTGTAGTVTVSGTTSSALSIQAAATINPTESEQTAVAAGKYTTGIVKVGAISSSYIGSAVPTHSASDVSASGSTVTVPSGYYATQVTKNVATGSAKTPATTISVSPTITISDAGLITAANSSSKNITPTVTAGYVSSGTAGTVTVNGSNTSQLSIYNGAHHIVLENYSVSISFTNPINTAYFPSNGINIYTFSSYDEQRNPYTDEPAIGHISSATGSTTVQVPPSKLGIVINQSNSGYVNVGSAILTGDITIFSTFVYQPGEVYEVTGNGTIVIDGTNWYDD